MYLLQFFDGLFGRLMNFLGGLVDHPGEMVL